MSLYDHEAPITSNDVYRLNIENDFEFNVLDRLVHAYWIECTGCSTNIDGKLFQNR
jgi:hypothetical protein